MSRENQLNPRHDPVTRQHQRLASSGNKTIAGTNVAKGRGRRRLPRLFHELPTPTDLQAGVRSVGAPTGTFSWGKRIKKGHGVVR